MTSLPSLSFPSAFILCIAIMLLLSRARRTVVQVALPIIVVTLVSPVLVTGFAYVAATQTAFATNGEGERFVRLLAHLLNLASGIAVSVIAFGLIYRQSGIRLSGVRGEEARITSRRDSIYFAVIVWTTVGFGDIVPSGRWTRLVCAYEALLGYFTLGVAVTEVIQVGAAIFHIQIATPG